MTGFSLSPGFTATGDIMLGWIKIEGIDGVKRDFYIRQLWDSKMSAMVEFMEPRGMTLYARFCNPGDRLKPVAVRSALGSAGLQGCARPKRMSSLERRWIHHARAREIA